MSSVSRHILIVTAGSHGDLFPFLGVGRALKQRGHRVTILANPYFKTITEIAGFDYAPLGERMAIDQMIKHYGLMHPLFGAQRVMQLFIKHTPSTVGYVRDFIENDRPDAILAHHICLGIHSVAESEEIPCAVASLAPAVWFSTADPILSSQFLPGRFGRALSGRAERIFERLVLRKLEKDADRARMKCGLAPYEGSMRGEWRGGDINLGLWSEAFRARQPDDPRQSKIVGFSWYDGPPGAPSPPGIEDFLKDGEPPILFCLGTTAVHNPGRFYENAVKACRNVKRRGILLAGTLADGWRPGKDMYPVRYAPLSRIAPRCAVNVVHGGIGSTAQALRAGKPTLVVPFAHDQFNNGVRVESLGVGSVLYPPMLSAGRMTHALEQLLDSESIQSKAAALGARLASEDGGQRAADALLGLIEKRSVTATARA